MSLAADIHLQATERFIAVRPVDVVVKRTTRTATSDGGKKRTPIPDLPPQTVRVVEKLPAQATEKRMSDDGQLVVPTHVAVAMPDTDFQRKDTFTAYGERWEVVYVSRLPEWRLSLELISRGTE